MKKENSPAENIVQNVCNIKKDERVLIIANPATSNIAQDLYTASNEIGAKTVLMYQNAKTSFDNAEKEVLAAIASNPDVCFSISAIKLGKDPEGAANPYQTEDGQNFNNIFDYLLEGKKTMRAVWTPGITQDMFDRTVNIDYKLLSSRCRKMEEFFKDVKYIHVSAPAGTDIMIPVYGRKLLSDDGDFSVPGNGGNIPAGEVFISPVVGSGNDKQPCGCQGQIVYDGSMTFDDGDSLIENPIKCIVKNGFVTEIEGKAEAKRLLKTITEAEQRAIAYEKEKKLPEGMGVVYSRNARNIGELGIGLNPAATITGNMLEDEKSFNTCHFAIGENYDNDAPSLIHLDGVVRNPTIKIIYENDSEKIILENGILKI